jgi:hypothetical protein
MLRIRRRVVKWALLALGLPLAARALHSAADLLESRQGTTPAVRNLRRAGGAVEGVQDRVRGRSRREVRGSQPGAW